MREKVQKSIDELRSEISSLEVNDKESKEKLDQLIGKLENQVEKMEIDSVDELVENLNESMSHFETSHPQISKIINNIMSALSGIGI